MQWKTSSYTPPINQLCVEVALDEAVYVDGAQLCVSPAAWASFIGTFGNTKG